MRVIDPVSFALMLPFLDVPRGSLIIIIIIIIIMAPC
jgi:hypothetical protein